MNTTVVARKINERRHRPNPVITTGEIISTIGSEGMQEAVQRMWLVPDMDTGFLMVNQNAGKLAEIAEACNCPECHQPDCACACLKFNLNNAQPACLPKAMREGWGAPGVGGGSNGSGMQGQTPLMPHAPPPPTSPTTTPPRKPQIGDQVAAKEIQNGKERLYPGKVANIAQDGRARLDFGNGERPPMDTEYGPEQLSFVQPTGNA